MFYLVSILFLFSVSSCIPSEKSHSNELAIQSFLIEASMIQKEQDQVILRDKKDKDSYSRNKIKFLNKYSKDSCYHHSLHCSCGLYIVNPERTKVALFNNCSTCLKDNEIETKLVKNFPNPKMALFLPPQEKDTDEIILRGAAFNADGSRIAAFTDRVIYVWDTTTKEQLMKRILSFETPTLIALNDKGSYIAVQINSFDFNSRRNSIDKLSKRIEIIKISDPTIVHSISVDKLFVSTLYIRNKTLVIEDYAHKKEFNVEAKKRIKDFNTDQKKFLGKMYSYFSQQEDKKLILDSKNHAIFLSLPEDLQKKIGSHVFFIVDNYIDTLD